MAQKWWTLTAVVTGVFMLVLDITIVNVALPYIGLDFHAPLSDLQWVIDAYALALAAGLLTGGSLGDLWGRRRLYAVGTAIFTVGSLLCGLATGPLVLSIARAGQGIGGAVVWATSLALLGDAFRGRDRGTAFGIYGGILGIAAAVGPLLGGVLTSGLSWRWIFWVNVPVGIVVIIVTLTKLRESSNPAASRPDWPGFLTFGGALGLLVYGLIGSADGWAEPEVYGSLIAAGALLVLFLLLEFKQKRPMLDMRLFRKPTFTGGLIAAFGLNASVYALFPYLVLYLQQQLGQSAAQAGVRFLALTAAMFVASTIAGRLTSTVPVRLMIGGGFVLIGAGILLMYGLTPSSGWTDLLPGMIISGAGAGMVTVPLASTAVGVVDVSQAGMASGINATARQVGIATGIAALGAIFTSQLRETAADHLRDTPLAAQAQHLADGMGASTGPGDASLAGLPATAAELVDQAARTGFVDGLNLILVIGAAVAFVSALFSLVLIRHRDFVPPPAAPAPAAAASAAEAHGS
ncbi:MFS transporter [Streptosporangium roseum]|uniref:RemN protein n=1 Tax=Streptosporangium roseum (strain ATCC 12428 / DSM 43021 / JCM 3005 / KCTC 9067 / NCIMB 10171 / NRRL 2505 / NI 9100) TaxID=479432 RepID=D2BBN1_STRRD|nr:MFS transporter [Streptosporangium roseum]ACZ86100.1 RemN protein [Streptosporangium roseum DSM 43021]